MIQLISFGNYVFQNIGTMYSDQFANVIQRATRLPGMDGGLDQHGMRRAPSEIGNVRFDGVLSLGDVPAMQAQRDRLRGIANWGVNKLTIKTADPVQPYRWTWARLSSLSDPIQITSRPEYRMAVSMTFQVVYPRWFDIRIGDVRWGDGSRWGTGAIWGGGLTIFEYAGPTQDFTIYNRGNADSIPILAVSTDAVQSLPDGVEIQRIAPNGQVAEGVFYQPPIASGGLLQVDCQVRSVRLNGMPAYAGFTFTQPEWITLPPGEHVLRITGDGAATISVDMFNTWI